MYLTTAATHAMTNNEIRFYWNFLLLSGVGNWKIKTIACCTFHSSRKAGPQMVISHFMISNIVFCKCLQPRLDRKLPCNIQQKKVWYALLIHAYACPFACMYDRYCIYDLRQYVCLSVDIHIDTSYMPFQTLINRIKGGLKALGMAFTYLDDKYWIGRDQ